MRLFVVSTKSKKDKKKKNKQSKDGGQAEFEDGSSSFDAHSVHSSSLTSFGWVIVSATDH